MSVDSPDLAAAKRLLDAAKNQGFRFQRIAPGPDGPLRGVRETPEFLDELYLAGLWAAGACSAIRRRRCALLVPGGLPVTGPGRGRCTHRAAHRGHRLDVLVMTAAPPERRTPDAVVCTSRRGRSLRAAEHRRHGQRLRIELGFPAPDNCINATEKIGLPRRFRSSAR